ncbi:MAG TPA: hypothetical protein VHP81_11460 [Lachnospiraceae bacterium]|nr:hypothetical protein [Lachnospiraceae bacterium]
MNVVICLRINAICHAFRWFLGLFCICSEPSRYYKDMLCKIDSIEVSEILTI